MIESETFMNRMKANPNSSAFLAFKRVVGASRIFVFPIVAPLWYDVVCKYLLQNNRKGSKRSQKAVALKR
jgi:hypothetical protein